MSLTYTVLDVFTTTHFCGNPVAIVHVPLGPSLTQDKKQSIARELNLSETVFLHEQTAAYAKVRRVRIDIFTPYAEVPFAGHPTVGTANYILHHLKLDRAKALMTKAGPLPFKAKGPGAAQLVVAHNLHVHDDPFASTEFGDFPVVSIVRGMTFILAELPDVAALGEQDGNLVGAENTYTMKEVLDPGWRVGIVASYFYVDLGLDADGTRKLRTRGFGSREDPATGSAASALCCYLALTEKYGGLVRWYLVTQGVEMGRRSEIHVQVTLNSERSRVMECLLSGSAVKVIEGKIEMPRG
ncbi:phenazine biosynthesis protein-like protein phzf family [Xylariaceae sp. FL0662B]|nr:phenazine biosynthesis protein-like protein phzf family [Xylariaceae sp. FL0662B]